MTGLKRITSWSLSKKSRQFVHYSWLILVLLCCTTLVILGQLLQYKYF